MAHSKAGRTFRNHQPSRRIGLFDVGFGTCKTHHRFTESTEEHRAHVQGDPGVRPPAKYALSVRPSQHRQRQARRYAKRTRFERDGRLKFAVGDRVSQTAGRTESACRASNKGTPLCDLLCGLCASVVDCFFGFCKRPGSQRSALSWTAAPLTSAENEKAGAPGFWRPYV